MEGHSKTVRLCGTGILLSRTASTALPSDERGAGGDRNRKNRGDNAGKPGNSRRTGAGRRAGRFCGEETDSKDEPQAEAEQPSEEEDFKLAEKPKKVSQAHISRQKAPGTAKVQKQLIESGIPVMARDGRVLRERNVKGMRLAKIIGTVVATRKDNSLVGYKLMIIRRIDGHGNFIDSEEVAVDYVGAGIGETVLIGSGSSVRVDQSKREAVIDMAIIGIVDTMDI